MTTQPCASSCRFASTVTLLLLLHGVGLLASSADAQTNPVPLINQPLVPDAAVPGGSQFTLTVNGTGFVSNSAVNWNGSPRSTVFVSGSQLSAAILAADIATAGTVSVTVVNPAPGGGTSNTLSFPIISAASAVAFSSTTLGTGTQPSSVVVADLNGDGKLDLAVANFGDSTVSIFLGNGDGTFQPRVDYPTVPEPVSVAAADFNEDGHLDLAVVSGNGCSVIPPPGVSILLGNGDGTFQPHVDYPVGCYNRSVVAADFNGDGKLDLAVGSGMSGPSFSIMLGNGDGTFQSAVNYQVPGGGGASLAIGDFNRDGKLDLAVGSSGFVDSSVYLFLGNGDGTFGTTPSTWSVGFVALGVAAADFNGDGKLDLVSVGEAFESLDGGVSILLGDGDGTFQAHMDYSTGVAPVFVATGDSNGDGALDLALVKNGFGQAAPRASVLLGKSDGTFGSLFDFSVGTSPTSLALGDLNGDGRLDMAVVNRVDNTISILVQVPTPAVTLTSSSLSFSNQTIGVTSAAQTVALKNIGSASLTISSISVTGSDNGDFALAISGTCPVGGGSLSVGANCTIDVTFTPTTTGSRAASVSIVDNAVGSPHVVSLSGLGTAVSLSPTSLTFAGQNVGTTSSQYVTLTNHGSASLSVTSATATGDFSALKECPPSIKSQASCRILVQFKPTQTGTRTGTLTITDSDPGSPQLVALTGTGTAPAVSLSTPNLSFAGQLVGTSSAAQSVTLSNTGDGALTISSISFRGANAGDFAQPLSAPSAANLCGTTVAAQSSCIVFVSFKPTAGGGRSATLTLSDDAAGTPQDVALSGTGQDFVVSAGTTSATVTAGQTASYMLTLASQGGFSGAVSLTCAGAPAAATCSLSPTSVALAESGTAAVTVTTTARSLAPPIAPRRPPGLGSPEVLLLTWLTVLLLAGWTRPGSTLPKRRQQWTPLGAALVLVMLWAACGGGRTPGPPPVTGTPAGTYTFTVAATASGLTNSVSLTLVVN
ncbi:MAG: hypothetical protein DMG24_14955 [Acidobacteria bacterium]|nr:MAG: hypothetical protein DMG24_14955 [Acidobacteriota bacterium]